MAFLTTLIQEMGVDVTNEETQIMKTIFVTQHRFSINNSIRSGSG